MAEHLQSRPAALILGLPTARASHLPRSGLPANHGHHYAAASQSARSRIPVRSVDLEVKWTSCLQIRLTAFNYRKLKQALKKI